MSRRAGARLLVVEGVAKVAGGFFLHAGIVGNGDRARKPKKGGGCATICGCNPCAFLPVLPRASISAGATKLCRGCCEYFARYGDVYRVFAPSRGVYDYVINHPDDIKQVLLSNHRNYTKGQGMDRVKILLGNGIMTSEGDFWRRQRRMMQPDFHRRVHRPVQPN